jgi:hypothetical protein
LQQFVTGAAASNRDQKPVSRSASFVGMYDVGTVSRSSCWAPEISPSHAKAPFETGVSRLRELLRPERHWGHTASDLWPRVLWRLFLDTVIVVDRDLNRLIGAPALVRMPRRDSDRRCAQATPSRTHLLALDWRSPANVGDWPHAARTANWSRLGSAGPYLRLIISTRERRMTWQMNPRKGTGTAASTC